MRFGKVQGELSRQGKEEVRERNKQREVRRGGARWFCWLSNMGEKDEWETFSHFFLIDGKVQKFCQELILSSLSSQDFYHLCVLEAMIPSAIARWALFSFQFNDDLLFFFLPLPFLSLHLTLFLSRRPQPLDGTRTTLCALCSLFWFPFGAALRES